VRFRKLFKNRDFIFLMGFKNLSPWLKGGIIGLIFGLLPVVNFLFSLLFVYRIIGLIPLLGVMLNNAIIFVLKLPATISASVLRLFVDTEALGGTMGFGALFMVLIFLSPILYFLVGALIGWIIGKIKSRNLE